MKAHRNLVWVRGDAETIKQIESNRKLSALVVAMVEESFIGIRKSHLDKFMAELTRIGIIPSVVRGNV